MSPIVLSMSCHAVIDGLAPLVYGAAPIYNKAEFYGTGRHDLCQPRRKDGSEMPDSTESPVLTVEDAGKLLMLSRGSAYEAARRGDIPTIRIGRRLLVPRARLMAMLAGEREPVEA